MKCKYEIAYSERDRMKSKPCNKPCVTSFCAEHAYCQELLDAAKALDYPRYVLAYNGKEAVYTLAGGPTSWQGYAARHPKRRHDDLMQRLKAARMHYDDRQAAYLAEVA